jgi:mannose-6-phosphate isomerase-like protein (cupin superfamily)
VHVQTKDDAPLNRRGGQESFLLLARGQFGSRNLAITWVDGAPGSEQGLHRHSDNEQVYVIVRGRGVMKAGGEEQEVGPGTMVFIPPGTDHAIRNTGSDTLTFVSATSPPFDHEALAEAFLYHGRGLRSG